MAERATIEVHGPFDLELSLRAAGSFIPAEREDASVLRRAVRVDGEPALFEVQQISKRPPALEVTASPERYLPQLRAIAEWVVRADLDLRPFYRVTAEHPVLGPIAKGLRGLKPLRPASLFEMAVTAITEQQISMIAAHAIRQRLVERFGDQIDGLWVFPTPERLAHATEKQLLDVGLSHAKSGYVRALAKNVADGSFVLEALKTMPDEDARTLICTQRGFGQWSADYILVRGLGRADSVPADDLGVRTVVGIYLGNGERMKPDEVREALEPLAPYRGLAVFYLFAQARLIDRPKEHKSASH